MHSREIPWIYDWNKADEEAGKALEARQVKLNDETLRDGLQSPSAKVPPVEAKVELLHILVKLGVTALDIGFPAAGPRLLEDSVLLAGEIAEKKLPLYPNCAARTVLEDVQAIEEVSERAGMAVEVAAFLGSSPVRMYVEGWDLPYLLKRVRETVAEAVRAGLPVMFVMEDTTRTHPQVLHQIFTAAIEYGARRICAADTVGFSTPAGAERVIGFLKELIKQSGEAVEIDWHGHTDRALALACTLAAFEAGADRLHASALGLGERVGNTPLDLLMVNLKIMGLWKHDVYPLKEYVEWAERSMGASIPKNYPVFGKNAFRTGTGVHAAALAKAKSKGDPKLVDLVYSAVPASWWDKKQSIEIGPMSGFANVQGWLKQHGEEITGEKVDLLKKSAKEAKGVLSEGEIRRVLEGIKKA